MIISFFQSPPPLSLSLHMAEWSVVAHAVISFSSFLYWIWAYMYYSFNTRCDIDGTRFALGVAIVSITVIGSIFGLIGATHKSPSLIRAHLAGILLVFVLLAFSAISDLLSPAKDFLGWNQRVQCLLDQKVCDSNSRPTLTPMQTGCCQPPTSCGFVHGNGTDWINPRQKGEDCGVWGNDKSTLCYNCNSCKAGFLAHLKKTRETEALVKMGLIGLQILIFLVGRAALESIKAEQQMETLVNDPLFHTM